MCLQRVYNKGKQKAEVLASFPEMVNCWKVVYKRGNQHGSKYYPEMFSGDSSLFLAGWNKTEPFMDYRSGYKIAFHAFRTIKGARKWHNAPYKHIVKCKTEKKDIVAIGEQSDHLCIVTKRIWMPKPKKKPEG